MTMTAPSAGETEPQIPTDEIRVYRGRSLAALLPQIRSELGPGAVVVRQREGRAGGLGGFFAQRFIEVEATGAGPRIDIYDEDAADRDAWGRDEDEPAPTAAPAPETIAAATLPELIPMAADAAASFARPSFAAHLAAAGAPAPAQASAPPATDTTADAQPAPAAAIAAQEHALTAPGSAAAIQEELLARGIGAALAQRLIAGAVTHRLPFGGGSMRDAVRRELALALPQFAGLPADGACVALAGAPGSGTTSVAATLALAYHAAGALAVRTVVVGADSRLTPLADMLARHGIPVRAAQPAPEGDRERNGELVVIDTDSVSPSDTAAIDALAGRLAAHAPDAVLVTLPATAAAAPCAQLLHALAPLRPSALVVTHTDETDQLGAAIEVSIAARLPIAFFHDGPDTPAALRLADPTHIATEVLP